MKNRNRLLGSVVLTGLGVLALAFALSLGTRGGGLISFAVACPFLSAAILLFLAAIGLHRPAFGRAALLGLNGGVVIGVIAFLAGFFGPSHFRPNANQGPLLGIFITGPIGTLVGMVFGVLTAITMRTIRQRHVRQVSSESAPSAAPEEPST